MLSLGLKKWFRIRGYNKTILTVELPKFWGHAFLGKFSFIPKPECLKHFLGTLLS